MTLRAMLDPAILPAYASSAWRIGRRAVRGHRRFPGDARAIARACVEAAAGKSPQEMLDGIFLSVREFSRGAEQSDDITALVLRYGPSA